MNRFKTFLLAILCICGLFIINEAIAQKTKQVVLDENIFDVVVRHVPGDQTGLEVKWYPPDSFTKFLIEYRDLASGETHKLIVSGDTFARLKGIDPLKQYSVSVKAINDLDEIVGYSPKENWLGKRARMLADLNPQTNITQPAVSPALEATLKSLDSNNFPFIYTYAAVDTGGKPVAGLTKENFTAFEDGRLQTDFFEVTPPDSGGNVRILDFIFVIDNSGSMKEEHQQVKDNVKAFVDSLAERQIDVRLGLVRFGQTAGGGQPIIMNNGNMTGDINYFKTLLNQMIASGGTEPGIEAVFQAATTFSFRPGSQRHFLLITDEDSDGGDLPQTIITCQNNGITVHAAVLCSADNSYYDYCNETSIRGATEGLLFDVIGPYSEILERLKTKIGNTYIVRYRSDNPICDGQQRAVRIQINAFGQSEDVNGAYIPCAAPIIQRTQATINLSKSAQVAGSPLTIAAYITDSVAPFVQSATVFYRQTGAANYVSVTMSFTGNNIYEAVIPGSNVITPGIDYYITATDGQVTSSDPSVDPGTFPYQIAVLPNQPPQITHTPVISGTPGQNVLISATIVDNTNYLTGTDLYYREFGTLLFDKISMSAAAGDQYEGTIPGSILTNAGVEYFIRAVDNFGLAAVHGDHIIITDPPECQSSFSDDFEDGFADGWNPLNSIRWEVTMDRGDLSYFLNTTYYPLPDGNRLGEYSLISGKQWSDFEFTCQARVNDDVNSHDFADFAIAFGYQDESHYYYLMINHKPGQSGIYKIKGNEARLKIGDFGQTIIPDNDYHEVRLKRNGTSIEAYYNQTFLGMVNDSEYSSGAIGVGSFNDSAFFDEIEIKSETAGGSSYSENFDDGTADGWHPNVNTRWNVGSVGSNLAYCLNVPNPGGDEYSLLLKKWQDFVLEMDAKVTDTLIRNFFIIFGTNTTVNSTGTCYYLRFTTGGVDLFRSLVPGQGVIIASAPNDFVSDNNYHTIKIERKFPNIKVHVDGQQVIEVNDNTFTEGFIGIGAWKTTACFDNVVITSQNCPSPLTTITIPSGLKVPAGHSIKVPIIVSSQEFIGLAQFTVEYDKNDIQFDNAAIGPDAPGFSISLQRLNPPFPVSTPGTNQNLTIQISGGGTNYFTGEGKTVLDLNFTAIGSVGDKSPLASDTDCSHTFLTTKEIDDFCGNRITFNNGDVTIITAPELNGHVLYYSASRPVKDATLTLTGNVQSNQVTDEYGFYRFSNIAPGNYTLVPSKGDDNRNAIKGSDALLLMRYIAFLDTLTKDQLIAADITQDGTVAGSDVVGILRYLVFYSINIGETGKWHFDPQSVSLNISTGVTQDFKSYLYGDVTSDWGVLTTVNQLAKVNTSESALILKKVTSTGSEIVRVSVNIQTNQNPIHTILYSVTYDTSKVYLKTVERKPVLKDYLIEINDRAPGKLHVAAIGVRPILSDQAIFDLSFEINNKRAEVNQEYFIPLTFSRAELNDNNIRWIDGGIEVTAEISSNIPADFELLQNYPNPFNLATTFKFGIPEVPTGASQINLVIYNVNGQRVRQLLDADKTPGYYTINWDGRDDHGRVVSTGIYFYTLKSEKTTISKKLLLIK